MDTDATVFWSRVKTLIKAKGLTQELLCKEHGISLGTFKHWIMDKNYPNAAQSVAIAKTLGTSVEYLVTGEESNPYKAELDSLKAGLKDIVSKYN